ncbi:MAG: metal-dependent transcriptional regulator [Candidatus Bathyarchaeota archaeon]|nr:metal-dependent transcriptional regulator [Candidatus Bathyarchaeota archaeon]
MEAPLSHEAEEYIETIYKLQKRNGIAKTKDLAQAMHIVPGSITNTIQHLESHSLVYHEPYRGVKLTREGEKIALEIIRKHRLAECLLTDVLKAEWSSVHEDACKLEHALTPNVTDLLDEKLGHPKFCPHGNPIPTKNGVVEEQCCIALTEANMGETYLVAGILNEGHASLEQLAEAKIKPEAEVNVVKLGGDEVVLVVEGNECCLNRSLAANVLLKKTGGTSHATKTQR